ncbi:hypothetical protein EDD21DRAFT_107182 [Dissophora ornata]|nr:hypothetical protein EDD21DRAFT_107182 [Dissophora ornata]
MQCPHPSRSHFATATAHPQTTRATLLQPCQRKIGITPSFAISLPRALELRIHNSLSLSTTTTTMLSRDLNGQEDPNASASFAHSLSVAPLDTANTIHNISMALNNGINQDNSNADLLTMEALSNQYDPQQQQQQPESRMAVAELLVSLAHSSRSDEEPNSNVLVTNASDAGAGQSLPIYRNAVDYVSLVKRAYENNPRIYTEFLDALEKYHSLSLPLDQLVQTVMSLFQDQPDLLLGFKEFLPEAQGLLNQLVPPKMYSDYKDRTATASSQAPQSFIPSTMLATSGMEKSVDICVNFSSNWKITRTTNS